MAGEAVDALIRARMARTGEGYAQAFHAVCVDPEDGGDMELQHYRLHGTSSEVERIRVLEAQVRYEAGKLLDQCAGRRKGETAAV